jgi:hypothetical protein
MKWTSSFLQRVRIAVAVVGTVKPPSVSFGGFCASKISKSRRILQNDQIIDVILHQLFGGPRVRPRAGGERRYTRRRRRT